MLKLTRFGVLLGVFLFSFELWAELEKLDSEKPSRPSTSLSSDLTPTQSPSPEPSVRSNLEPSLEPSPSRTMLIFSVGFPVPANLGIRYSFSDQWKILLTAGYAPLPFLFNGNYSAGNLELLGKWHPWSNAFFIGAGCGYQTIQYFTQLNLGGLTTNVGPIPANLYLNSFNAIVGLGFLWHITPSLYFGVDAGVTIPIIFSGGMSVDTNSPAGLSLQAASQDMLSYFSSFVLPRVGLLRVGWAL